MTKTLFLVGIILAATSGALSADELSLDDVFPTDRVLDVQIEVAPEDWDTIRRQSRDLLSALPRSRKNAPVKAPYTYVEASVTIDGVNFPRVGIRKKGFIGSQSSSRPSLKIKLNHVDPEGAIGGLKNLTLNNNKQDPGMAKQFMGYALYNAVGSPAPRAAYAKLTVNGKSLGIYTHVESARKPLLERGFGDDSGTLFEGTVIDFYEGWVGGFERELGDDVSGREKIKELSAVLNRDAGTVIVGAESEKRAHVPTSDEIDDAWTAIDFDDSAWVRGRGGAGYEIQTAYESQLDPAFDFENELHERGTSIYLRVPFELDDPTKIGDLTLWMKFDDGFVASINGQRVLSVNAPRDASWDSEATDSNSDWSRRAPVSWKSPTP